VCEGAPSPPWAIWNPPQKLIHHEKAAIGGVIFESSFGLWPHQPNVGGRIMKMTREQLFAAPKVVRQAKERIERGKVAVSAARAQATEIAQQCAAQPRLRPTALQSLHLERLKRGRIGPVVKRPHGLR
jgi:hypothetical protein